MMKGISLQELAAKIEGNISLKHDMIVAAKDMELQQVVAKANEGAKIMLHVPTQGDYHMRPLAHDHLGGRLQIPAKYYDRMLSEAPELLVENVNTWLAKSNKKNMVRTLNGECRAVLSNSYQRIEHEEIAAVVLPILKDVPGIKIVSAQITERRLYIHAATSKVRAEVKRGDIVEAGVLITNSEVGAGAACVTPLIMRLVCDNGMVVNDARFSARHVGRKVEDNEALWADDTRRADDTLVLKKIRDMVRAALDEVTLGQRAARFLKLTEMEITGDPEKVVEVLAQKAGISDTERAGVLRALIKGGDLSAWGLTNAITFQAHEASSYDRAVEFEQMGGALAQMDQDNWQRLLATKTSPSKIAA